MEQLQRFPIEDTPKQKKKKKKKKKMPTGPNELFTIVAMAWQAMTALLTSNRDTNNKISQNQPQ
jgi:hypothetical protein